MPGVPEGADLQVEDNQPFQRGERKAQRLAWLAAAALLLAAALGLFGSGPLSHAAATGETLSVEYERLARRSRTVDLVIRCREVSGETFTIGLQGEYLERADVERMTPTPVREVLRPGERVLTFAAEPGRPAEVELRLSPRGAGLRRGAAAFGQEVVEFWMFVYP